MHFLFQLALADTGGGLPGLVVCACSHGFRNDSSSPVQHLHLESAKYVYVNREWDEKMEVILSASLARIRVESTYVLIKQGENNSYTVERVLDGGIIYLQDNEIRLALAVLSKFSSTNHNIMIPSLLSLKHQKH